MNKTETVSIGRKGFVCEEDAYEILKNYLSRAKKSLNSDPDKDEIMQDLEIALSGHLTDLAKELVVDKVTAKKAIEIMGEVQSTEEADSSTESEPENAEEISNSEKLKKLFSKSLYKDHSREIIDGACAGIAKTLNVDPIWIRIAFVVFTVITNGFGLLVYLIMMLIMKESEDRKSLSASEVVDEVKDKIQNSSEPRKPYESVLYGLFRGIGRAIILSVRIILLLFMLVVGMAWSTLLFFMISSPNKIVLFGANPSWVDFTAILALGIVIMVPLFVLIATIVGSDIVKSVRFNLVTWCLWLVALLIGAGAMINVVPDVRARLVREVPQTKNVYVEVEDNKLLYTCITLWGDCHEGIPRIYSKKICDIDVQVITKDDGNQYNSLQTRSWTMQQESFDYPANDIVYCEFVKSLVQLKGATNVIFDDRSINDMQTEFWVDSYGPENRQIENKIKWSTNYFIRRTL